MDQPSSSGDLHILQLTDCHLYEDPRQSLLGVDTRQSLEGVIQSVAGEEPPPDAVVATGDLVHDGSAEGYRRLGELLAGLGIPAAALPGNHDAPETMRSTLPGLGVQVCGHLDLGNWRLILLDSHRPGQEGGRLPESELERLDHLLLDTTRNVFLFVHHHPLPVGSRWLDRIALENGGALLERAQRHHHLRGIAWGHVHQAWEGQEARARLFGTPSTCVQFAPRQEEFSLALEPPAWRRLVLHADGSVNSSLHHLERMPLGLAVDSVGY